MGNTEALEGVRARSREVARELNKFAAAAQALSSSHPRLIDNYPDQWVAIVDGDVIAHGDSMKGVMTELRASGVRPEAAIIRYISTSERTMFF